MVNGSPKSRAETQRNFLKTVTNALIPDFLNTATEIFGQYKWAGSFGGKKWSDISKTGSDRLLTKLDRVAFIDRVFDLKHNGGPIFDKNGAVHNMSLQQFLDCKLEMTKDSEWSDWLQYAHPSLIVCLKLAHKTSLWQGSKDLDKVKSVPALFNPNADTGAEEYKPVKKPPTPSKPLAYPVDINADCPQGEHT